MASSYSVNLPQQRFKAEQVRENERLVWQKIAHKEALDPDVDMYPLMLKAGSAVFDLISDSYCLDDQKPPQLLVVCGYGNNGGDGYVVAKLAIKQGWPVELVQVGEHTKLSDDAFTAYQDFCAAGGKVTMELTEWRQIAAIDFNHNYVVVDALLGTGVSGPVREPMASLIDFINQQSLRAMVSIDVPSGLNSDTGAIANVAIKADKTCTFIGIKQGLSTGLGPDFSGQLYFAGLEICEPFAVMVPASAMCANQKDLQRALPRRALASHKGNCGHVLLIGSDKGMSGAIRMAGRACLRTGAGLVSILTHRDNELVVASECAEMMVTGVESDADIRPWLERVDVVAIGPGLGDNSWGHSMLSQVLSYLKHHNKACVLDADALNILSRLKFYPRFDIAHTVITPHPLEAARLLGCETAVVQQDRFDAALELTAATGAVALLKGVGTVINVGNYVHDNLNDREQNHHCASQYINTTGNPGMATAGMGDILTGIVAALMAQQLSASDAAILGAYIHGAAADLAAEQGERGMMATDVLAYIRQIVN